MYDYDIISSKHSYSEVFIFLVKLALDLLNKEIAKMQTLTQAKEHQSTILENQIFLIYCALLASTLFVRGGYLTFIALLCFFFYTAWNTIKTALFIIIAVSVACLIFPALGAIAFVAAIIFFIMRLNFILNNFWAFLLGIYFYGSLSFLGSLTLEKSQLLFHSVTDLISAIITFIIFTFIFFLLYRKVSAKHYAKESLMYIIGVSPLLLFALILPFLKIPIIHDGIIAHDGVVHDGIIHDGMHMTDSSPHQATNTDGVVHVNSYDRSDGTHVHEHWRTLPDGIESNNISHKD